MFDRARLEALRQAHYTPRAWVDYVFGHIQQARQVADAHPETVRSVVAAGFGLFLLVFLVAGAFAAWDTPVFAGRVFVWMCVALVVHGAWIMAHLGLLTRAAPPSRRLGVPNIVTWARLVTVPGMCLCLASDRLLVGAAFFLVGAASDLVDGFLARRLAAETRLGTISDLLVDIVWNTGAMWSVVQLGLVPGWVLVLLVGRYAILLAGSALLYLVTLEVRIHPTLFGKASGMTIGFGMLLALANAALLPPELAARFGELIHTALGIVVAVSLVYVIVLGVFNTRRATASRAPAVVVDFEDAARRRRIDRRISR